MIETNSQRFQQLQNSVVPLYQKLKFERQPYLSFALLFDFPVYEGQSVNNLLRTK